MTCHCWYWPWSGGSGVGQVSPTYSLFLSPFHTVFFGRKALYVATLTEWTVHSSIPLKSVSTYIIWSSSAPEFLFPLLIYLFNHLYQCKLGYSFYTSGKSSTTSFCSNCCSSGHGELSQTAAVSLWHTHHRGFVYYLAFPCFPAHLVYFPPGIGEFILVGDFLLSI